MAEENAKNRMIETVPKGANSEFDIRVGAIARAYQSPAVRVIARELSPEVPAEPAYEVPQAASDDRPWDSLVNRSAARGLSPSPEEAEPPENPKVPEPHMGPIGWQSMGAVVVKK